MEYAIEEAWRSDSLDNPEVFLTELDALGASQWNLTEDGYTIVGFEGRLYGFYDTFFEAELALCQMVGGVSIGPNYVAIYDDEGNEIVYWHENEWLENPSLCTNVANAVRIYYKDGPEHMKKLLGL